MPLAVTFVRNGGGGSVRTAGSLAGGSGRTALTIEVKNESGQDTRLEQLVAIVIDAEGRVSARSTVALPRVVKAGSTASFQEGMRGPWVDGAVVGVATRFDGQAGYDGSCTPGCPGCDNVKSQQACEQFWLLLKREQSNQGALGQFAAERISV
ncbi:hypothetical protein [Luteitalea sp.]